MVGVQVLSYEMLSSLSSNKRIRKILSLVKSGDVVLIQGRLTPDEETTLISSALENVSGKFSGIEIAFLDSKASDSFLGKITHSLLLVLAKDRMGTTVVGPSKLIKEIKMNPEKLEILFK